MQDASSAHGDIGVIEPVVPAVCLALDTDAGEAESAILFEQPDRGAFAHLRIFGPGREEQLMLGGKATGQV